MSFLIVMTIGLIGLLLMAFPGMQRHGHSAPMPRGPAHSQGGLRLGRATHGKVSGSPKASVGRVAAKAGAHGEQSDAGFQLVRMLPSPRAIFSVMTMFGAFAYALVAGMKLSPELAACLALIPACLIEYFAVRPLWNLMFQFEGKPCSSLETLVMCDGEAVTPFRNGRGLVSVEHDGRMVQLSASLAQWQADRPVCVGDKLRIEEVHVAAQRVVVSLH